MEDKQLYYIKRINDYIKENKINKTQFAKLINKNPSQLSNFLNNDYRCMENYRIYQDIMRFVRDYDYKTNRKNNLEKYGLEISNGTIYDIKMLCENINKSLSENSNKVHIFIEDENWSENDDALKYIEKYDINFKVSNRNKMGICTDSDRNVTIDLDWIDNDKVKQLLEDVKIFD
jgi:hypothetical protein